MKTLADQFSQTRNTTTKICAPLLTEDYCIQSMPEVSPPKWHLAHTSWFFERFVLSGCTKNYEVFHPQYEYLFNSYYETVGPHVARERRGLLSRPSVEEIYRYRAHIDQKILELLDESPREQRTKITELVTLGLNHEQQHQELLVTDIKHIFATNPTHPTYLSSDLATTALAPEKPIYDDWLCFTGGLKEIGCSDLEGFSYDNESPRHKVYLQSYRLRSHLVTNGEYIKFIEAGGYRDSRHWLAEGWHELQKNNWTAPLYWLPKTQGWEQLTLRGKKTISESEPVCHLSFYEADAYARWKGARLPSEAEWECAAADTKVEGNFLENENWHPSQVTTPAQFTSPGAYQLYGDVWEWTSSPYQPYPGFEPLKGTLGEYNGKFMCKQMVLRGGSCATPKSHIRSTYRNFFSPETRWQFSGFRLAGV